MDALVLSGGSVKGCYQAGILRTVLRAGFRPEIVTGISVGALNGGFLSERAGAAAGEGKAPDWPAIGQQLAEFWASRVTGPDALIKKRGYLSLAWGILWGKFDGATDTAPLKRLVSQTLKPSNLAQSPVHFGAGAVNMDSGNIVYADRSFHDLLDYIIASAAIPFAMPCSVITGAPFYDGGLRDITPLKRAIKAGASRIICAVCQAEDLTVVDFKRGDVIALATRILDVFTNEILKDDLDRALDVNKDLRSLAAAGASPAPSLAAKKQIPILVVRPAEPLKIDIQKFSNQQVRELLKRGESDAVDEIRAAQADATHPGHEIAKSLVV